MDITLKQATVIDLWHALEDVPFIERPDCEQILDAPDGFLGFPWGAEKREIWDLFDKLYAPWGGITALLEDDPQSERKFQVNTPDGILEVCAEHENGSTEDYPEICVNLRCTEKQRSGKETGYRICRVEYDSRAKQILTCAYQPLKDDPVHVEVCKQPTPYKEWLALHEKEIAVLEVYDCNGEEIPPDIDIPDSALVVDWSQKSGNFDAELDCTLTTLTRKKGAKHGMGI